MSDKSDMCVCCGRYSADSIVCDLEDEMGMLTTCAACLDRIANDETDNPRQRELARAALEQLANG